MDAVAPSGQLSTTERAIERTIFASRWLLAPFYVGLSVSLLVLLVKFAQKTAGLVIGGIAASANDVVTGVLSLVDLSLVASLLLMVMFAGYESFVSGFELRDTRYKPSWMGQVDFGDLKLKLMTSIVAIAAIHVLEAFMNLGNLSDREIMWRLGILLGFVLSGTLLALMSRLSGIQGQ